MPPCSVVIVTVVVGLFLAALHQRPLVRLLLLSQRVLLLHQPALLQRLRPPVLLRLLLVITVAAIRAASPRSAVFVKLAAK
ncbi:MAG: hypothetical protein KatS3mg114_1334 [Planctomycetaceae bacterium]|nr:MAG: hypothetical protein KatS3mg114_1334 [Planctomycetaceae bacterium]